MLVWGFFVSTVLFYHGTYTINSLSHVFGSSAIDTGDSSRNNWFLALSRSAKAGTTTTTTTRARRARASTGGKIDITYYVLKAAVVARDHLGPQAGARRDARRASTTIVRPLA